MIKWLSFFKILTIKRTQLVMLLCMCTDHSVFWAANLGYSIENCSLHDEISSDADYKSA